MALKRKNPTHALIAALAVLTIAVIVLAVVLVVRNGGRDAFTAEQVREIASIKGEAERLAVEGKLAEAHAKYQQIEQRVAGRRIRESAVWDLTERAKADQDRVFSLLLSEMEAKLAARAAATRPTTRYIVVGNPPPSEEYPSKLLPETQPVVVASTQPANLLQIFRPLIDRGAEPSPQPSPGIPGEGVMSATTRPTTQASTQVARAIGIAPIPPPKEPVTDEQIGQAIQKGVNFLLQQFKADQIALDKQIDKTQLEGMNALVVYALLQSGQAISDPRLNIQNPQMSGLVERMKDHLMLVEAASPKAPVTYARSLRAAALAVNNRPQDREVLKADVEYLVKAHADGAYTYNDKIGRFDKVKTNEPPARENNPGLKWIGNLPSRTLFYIDSEKPQRLLLHNGEKPVPGLPMPPSPSPGMPGFRNMDPRERYQEPPGLPWDNSNSQYGLMGVWAGAEAGIEVPGNYWAIVDQHWKRWQLQTGEWEYDGTEKRGYYSMTVAGIASLFITYDFVEAPALGASVGREPFSANLAAALKWLEMGDNSINVEQGKVYHRGYNLYGLQRVGRASGFKYFGGHDWYKELATAVVAKQWPSGSWGRQEMGEHAIIDTAYTLLFLVRGRHPVMMNKLRFDGYWNNRSRDLPHLTSIASRELERVVNWQIVSSDRDWSDWLDSPILFISSHNAPKFKPEDHAKLRAFCDGGGMIFTHADAGSPNFNAFAGDLSKKLFPEYQIADLRPDHEIYSIQYPMKTKPPLKYVSNGSRILMVHSPQDLTTAWQVRDLTKRPNFELAINLFVYATGKAELRNRLNSPYIADAAGKSVRNVKIARVKYAGNWNPEPYSWERFSRYLKQQTGWSSEVVVAEPGSLKVENAPIAHLTGTAELNLSDAETGAIKNYVETGGTLIIDACGGSGTFAQGIQRLFAHTLPQNRPGTVAANDAMLQASAPGMEDIGQTILRPYAEQRLGKGAGRLEQIQFGKGRIIISGIDFSSGLIGSNSWGIIGYEPAYAMKLVKNLLIWAENQRR
ncbi:MAG TPA: DUF4159 domain-containing protein [Tepidisphaeraceae bacterium]|jgi:hypothetical protein|nr:DUF4159 domain-containing protein [Tepidisphaeraceae bacterium]